MDNNTTASSQGLLFCHKCGAQLLPDSVFCDKCGTKVATHQDRVPPVIQTANNENTTPTKKKKNKDSDDRRFITAFIVVVLIIVAFLLTIAFIRYNNYKENNTETGEGKHYYLDTDGTLKEIEDRPKWILKNGHLFILDKDFNVYLRKGPETNQYYDEDGELVEKVWNPTYKRWELHWK